MATRQHISDFKELDAWKNGRVLACEVYRLTAAFPPHERYGLASQMQRAAVSIPSNIAEGYARGTRQEYIHALKIARGSLAELETQLLLANDLQMCDDIRRLSELILVEYRLLHGLIRSLENRQSPSEQARKHDDA